MPHPARDGDASETARESVRVLIVDDEVALTESL
jgi:hypothetical protein